jgi:hypothetical protein
VPVGGGTSGGARLNTAASGAFEEQMVAASPVRIRGDAVGDEFTDGGFVSHDSPHKPCRDWTCRDTQQRCVR